MSKIYSIGEQEPWRLTKDSGYKLMLAICKTNAKVVSAIIDTTCPPTYACIRIELEKSKVPEFRTYFQSNFKPAEIAGGD